MSMPLAGGVQNPAMIVVVIGFLILSLALHEYGHAWVAFRCGDTTARDMGRLTLNPIAHIDPFMTIVLPLVLYWTMGIAFGGAKPVPVAPWNLRKPLRDMMLVAIAGPLVNLILAILFMLAWKLAVYVFDFEEAAILVQVLQHSIFFNLLLAAFNMIPIPPLDGSRVMAFFLPPAMRQSYQQLERFGMILVFGLMMTGMLRAIVMPVILFLYEVLDPLTGGVWIS